MHQHSKLPMPPLVLLVGLQALVSAASLVVEILAGRMLAPYVGMSLYTWTAVIAVVLAGFSLGHWIGGLLADKPPRQALIATAWWVVFAALSTAAAVWILRTLSGPLIAASENAVVAILLLCSAAFFLPSLAAGVPAPVLAQISISSGQQSSGKALGAMFAASAIGAIVGTLAAGFVFISWLGSSLTLLIITLVYLATACVLLAYARPKPLGWLLAGLAGLGALLLAGGSLMLKAICDHESNYFCIRVVDVSETAFEPRRMLVLDHLVHGTAAKTQPETMFTDYAALLDSLTLERHGAAPFSAFLIGGGSYALPRKWSHLALASRITVAEIDPQVTRVAQDQLWFDPSDSEGGIEVRNSDARLALMRDSQRYDVIIGDAFTDIAVPPHLVTLEFFQLVRSRLAPDGSFLMNVIDHQGRYRMLGSLVASLQAVFPHVEVWTHARRAAPGHQTSGERMIFVISASTRPTEAQRLVTRSPDPVVFARLPQAWTEETLPNLPGVVRLSDDFAPIDRLMMGAL